MSYTKTMQVVEDVLSPLEGRHVLDIGCGRGRLLRALIRRGAVATGVDPNAGLLALAREAAPEATLAEGRAEALPFRDGTFAGAVILNSLHHIPQDRIRDALSDMMRVLAPGAPLLVIEPLARGGYQQVFAPIDDETEIRAGALAHLDAFRAGGGIETLLHVEYDTDILEKNVEEVLSYGLAIDPGRAARIEAVRDEVVRLFAHHARETRGGYLLDQPMIAVAMRRGTA